MDKPIVARIPARSTAIAKPGFWASYRLTRPLALGTVSLLIGVIVWQVLSTFVFNPFLIPPPLKVLRTAVPMVLSGEIPMDAAVSMTRILVGFFTGSLAGIVLGVLLGRVKILHELGQLGVAGIQG